MRSIIAVGFASLLVMALSNPASAENTPRTYTTGKLLDVTVQPVDRGTAIIGNMAAPIRGMSYSFQIQVGDLVYFAHYTGGALSDSATWVVNDPIDFRFEKEKMFLRQPDGKEVRVWLAKTVRVPQGGQPPAITLAGQANRDADNNQLELEPAVQEVLAKLPKWRTTLSAADVESLPVQYKTGKQVEFLKAVAVEQLGRIDKRPVCLRRNGRAADLSARRNPCSCCWICRRPGTPQCNWRRHS